MILPWVARLVATTKRATYGGVLSEVGMKNRDGSTGCPICQNGVTDRRIDTSMSPPDQQSGGVPQRSAGFAPLWPNGVVNCLSCQTVFLQRRSATLLDKRASR